MKKMKIFSIAIMVAILCICTMQIAFAEATTPEGYCYDEVSGITFKLDDTTGTETTPTASTYMYGKYDGTTHTYTSVPSGSNVTITVPATITDKKTGKTYNVTKIGGYTFGVKNNARSGVTATLENYATIIIPEGIEEFEMNAFYSCKGIKKFVIPASVKKLNKYSFLNCTQMQSITFAGNLIEEIPDACFEKCQALTSIEIPEPDKDDPQDKVITIYLSAFKNNIKLAKVKINAQDVVFVGDTFPAEMGIINKGTTVVKTIFYVTTDTIKTNLMNIAKNGVVSGSNTYDVTGIANGSQIKLFFDPITIDNVTYSQYDENANEAIITGNTFPAQAEAKYAQDVIIPSTITVNGREITVKAVGPQAFCYLDANGNPAFDGNTIKSIKLPETVTKIGKQAFWRLNTMKTFAAKGDIVLNGDDIEIFRGCSSVIELDLKSVNMITAGMFFDCDDLKTIVIPTDESINIAPTAFDRCDLLTDVYLNAGTVTFEGTASTDNNDMKKLTSMKFHVPTESAKTALTTFGIAEDRVVTGKKLYLLDNLLGTYAVASEAMDEGKVIVATYKDDALVAVDEIKDVDFEVGYNEIETDLGKPKTGERKIFVWSNEIFPLGSMIK